MREPAVVEMLSRQADQLKDELEPMLEHTATTPETMRLMTLAQQVKGALRSVEPRPEFVADLKSRLRTEGLRLRQQDTQTQLHTVERRRAFTWLAAGVGGMLCVAGMAFMGAKAATALTSVLAGWLGWKATQPMPVVKLTK